MCADADLRVLGNGQIGEDLRRVRRVDARQRPLVRPDVARVAGLLAAAAGVHHDEGVDEPVAVVVVGREVDGRIGGGRRVVGQVASPRRPTRDRRPVDPEVAVGVPVERVRHPVGADDVARDVDEAVGRLGVELLDAAVGQHPGREEELLEVRGGRLHLLVGEVDEDHDDPHGAAQRGTLGGRGPDERRGRAGGELVRRDDQAILEAQRPRLRRKRRDAGQEPSLAASLRGLLLEPLAKLRAGSDEAGILQSTGDAPPSPFDTVRLRRVGKHERLLLDRSAFSFCRRDTGEARPTRAGSGCQGGGQRREVGQMNRCITAWLAGTRRDRGELRRERHRSRGARGAPA